jgi:hypothetical protein
MYLPTSDKEIIKSTLLAFKKRHRAINYNARTLRCDKIIERNADGDIEKIEIEVGLQLDPRITLNVWQDRWVLVDARLAAKKGWVWEWRYEGRLLGVHSGRTLIETLERTMSATFEMTAEKTDRLTAMWHPLLARGPKGVTAKP